jgi:hypothetical protein
MRQILPKHSTENSGEITRSRRGAKFPSLSQRDYREGKREYIFSPRQRNPRSVNGVRERAMLES